MSMKGFHLEGNHIRGAGGRRAYTLADYQQIKKWGFNTVWSCVFWYMFQNYEFQKDNINMAMFNQYCKQIELARQAGLDWVFEFRVQIQDAGFPSPPSKWCHFYDNVEEPRARTVCTPEGLARYEYFVRKIIRMLEAKNYSNLIGYNAWMMPFHASYYTGYDGFFYSTVFPKLHDIVRQEAPQKLCFVCPIHQNRTHLERCTIYHDSIYGFGFYWYKAGKGHIHGSGVIIPWDYDVEDQIAFLKPAIDFKTKNNVELYVVEFGVRGESIEQRDLLECKLKLLQQHHISWRYWSYCNWGIPTFCICDSNWNPKPLMLGALQAYLGKPETATLTVDSTVGGKVEFA